VPDLEGDSGGTEQNEMHGVLPAGTTSRGYELKSLAKATSVSLRTREVTVNRDVAIKECLPTSLSFCKRRTTQRVMPNSLLEAASASSMTGTLMRDLRFLCQ
jgi:hypothetical protein